MWSIKGFIQMNNPIIKEKECIEGLIGVDDCPASND